MIKRKPLYIVVIGFLLIVTTIISYLYLKFNYYENEIKSKRLLHNQLLSEFYKYYLELDSNEALKYDKYDFYYLTNSTIFKKDIKIDYDEHLSWLTNRINQIRFLNNEMKLLINTKKLGKTSIEEYKDLSSESKKRDSLKKKRMKKYYSTEEMMNIYNESEQDKNQIYYQKMKK